MKKEERPKFENIKSGAEFNRWYWLKNELVDICRKLNLPITGRKFDLRDRIMFALDNNGALLKVKKAPKPRSKFNWAKEDLNLSTIITDSVSFGQNFRRFMQKHIGGAFSFNTDFMAWVKNNTGKTLEDAILQWRHLEARKKDPNFKSKIADNNMFNQYTRDFLEDNPKMSVADARKFWLLKRQMPTDDGFIRYNASDLNLDAK